MTLKELREKARELGITGASKMNTERVTAAIAEREGPARVQSPDGRYLTVQRDGENVTVTWLCGEQRYFTVEDLRLALERFDSITAHGIWFEDEDSRMRGWAAVVRDGQFHADSRVDGGAGNVPWDELKAALQANVS